MSRECNLARKLCGKAFSILTIPLDKVLEWIIGADCALKDLRGEEAEEYEDLEEE